MVNENRVWWVQSKPVNEADRNSEKLREFQDYCLAKKLFGMGWKEDKKVSFADHTGTELTKEIADEFRSKMHNSAFTLAQNRFLEMKKGDVVLTRLGSDYYLGKMQFLPKLSNHPLLTWYSEVDEWKPLGTSKKLPHHVRGKIASRKYCGTVAEIDGFAAITLKQKAGIEQDGVTHIKEDSFFLAMDDEDLEDLMAHHMSALHKEYVFLPSSCKKNTPGIEYVMYNPETKKTIACQTKVNEIINVEDYYDYEEYEKIYLFSGKGYIGNPKANIIVVSKEALYQTLKNNNYFTDEIKQFFVLD